MTKTFFIVPGFKQKPTAKSFSWLEEFLSRRGFTVIIVPIKWERKTMPDWVEELVAVYNTSKTEINYILGFSYGAVITFLAANILRPKKIYLCSLSPDFQEDIPVMKKWIKVYIGKRRLKAANSINARDIAKELKIPSVVFYGEGEGGQYPQLKIRCEETTKLARRSRLVVVKNAPHDLSCTNYQEAIKAELKKL